MAEQKIDPSVKHPAYAKLQEKFDRTKDAFDGDVCKYVPQLSDQTDQEWKEMVERASYYNVVERSAQAVLGAMTRKPFDLTGMDFPVVDDVTPDVFLQIALRDVLLGARTVIMVDVDDKTGKSKLLSFDADDIINWAEDFVMIEETQLVRDPENKYNQVPVRTYRELYIGEDGFYHNRRWSQTKTGWEALELPDLMVNGALHDEIPIWVSTPYDTSWNVYNPPLHTQAELNINHMKVAVLKAHYLHFMGMPTFTISGELNTGGTMEDGTQVTPVIRLGSTKSPLHLEKDGKAGYAEVSGKSTEAFQAEMEKIEERMFLAGGRLLTAKKGVESVEALQVRSGAEGAVLETLTNALEAALNGALELCAKIDRVAGTPVLTLNHDFSSAATNPQMVAQMLAGFTAGAVTFDQLQAYLLNGELIDEAAQEPAVSATDEVTDESAEDATDAE